MSLIDIKTAIKGFSKNDQIELAMYILKNIQTNDEQKEEWFTKVVRTEVIRRKEAAIQNPEQSLSYEEVMKTIR